MSILNSTSPAQKYDNLGVYYRKNFLTQEEVDFLLEYSSNNEHDENQYHSGFTKAVFIKARENNWDQFKTIVSKIINSMKDVYASEAIHANLLKKISINTDSAVPEGMGDEYVIKDSNDKNGIVVKKFMKPTLDGWTAEDAAEADPAWCVIIGLNTDRFELGGEINVGLVSEKINAGDVIWFKNDVSGSYSISSFEQSPDINTPEGSITTDTVKIILDLTLTDNPLGYWHQ